MAEARRVCPTCGAAYVGDALFCPTDGSPLAARAAGAASTKGDPHLGADIGYGIRLDRLVGIGSMGRVYRGWQSGIERAVAVKILHRELMTKDIVMGRFDREARVAGGLLHPNVVTVHAIGTLPPAGDGPAGEPYLVMEYLDGLSLRSALAAGRGPLSLDRALHVLLQVCDAMGEAHQAGIVHRDLKPENIMLVRRGADADFAKVLDFGVARVGETDSSLATHAGALLGTATYACPESARGEPAGTAGDVYALALVLFECLSGAPPFSGKSPVDVLIQHAQADAPDVRSRSADVPDAIAELVAQNLRKNPAERAPDARVLGERLMQAARASGLGAEVVRAGSTLVGSAFGSLRAASRVAMLMVGAASLCLARPALAAPGNGAAAGTDVTQRIQVTPAPLPPAAAPAPSPAPVDDSVAPEPLPDGGLDQSGLGDGNDGAQSPPTVVPPPPGPRRLPPEDSPPISGTAPIGVRHAQEEDERVTKGQVEFGAGFFTLPGAQVCIASFVGCSKGDTSLALSAWPMFRRGHFAIGAGVMMGITSTANAPRNDPVDVPRDHYRRYFSVEITGRYYIALSERVDGWAGITTGLGVVNDTFQSQQGLSDKAVIGVRGVTLLTEGFTIGAGLGIAYSLSDNFLFGGGLRVSNWSLPKSPARDPLGDRASLTGNVATVDLGITLAYRSRLVF
jgi:tRNA A-37 threonylcarbamoyl transferase component Bud32